MKNNFITKIIGATLAFAMMIGGAVGINAAKQAKEVNADDVTGEALTFDANSSLSGNYDSHWAYAFTKGANGNAPAAYGDGIRVYNAKGTNKYGGHLTLSPQANNEEDYITSVSISVTESYDPTLKVKAADTSSNMSSATETTLNANNSVYTFTASNTSTRYIEFTSWGNTSGSYLQWRVKTLTINYTTSGSGGETPVTYSVTYDANGGVGTMTDSNSPYEAGSTVTVLENEFSREGYEFVGFNTAANGSGSSYDKDDTFTINANTTLYAQWEEHNTITISRASITDESSMAYSSWTPWAARGVSGFAQVYANANALQFNNTSLFNTSAVNGRIKSITMKKYSGTDRSWTVYGGDSPTSTDDYSLEGYTQIGNAQAVTSNGVTWNFPNNSDYSYFVCKVGSNASYIDSITIRYEPRVAASISGNTSVNSGEEWTTGGVKENESGDTVEGVTYSFTAGNGTSVVSSNTTNGTFTAAGSGTVTVSATKVGYTIASLNVTVIPVPYIAPAKTETTGYVGLNEIISFAYGDLVSLNPTVSSDNTSVVTVEEPTLNAGSGTVQINFVGAGSANVLFKDGSTERASIAVTVGISSVTISGLASENSIYLGTSLDLGATVTVNATGAYSNAVTWESDNTSVATVTSSGVVLGKAVGSANITVASNDYPSATMTCAVTVLNATTIQITDANLLGYTDTNIPYPENDNPVTSIIDDVSFAAVRCGAYGDGIQMRTKNDIASSIFNTTAVDVKKVVFVWADSKTVTAGKPYNLLVEFSNVSDFSVLVGEEQQVSVDSSTKIGEAVPTSSAKYVRIKHANQGAVYLDAIKLICVNPNTYLSSASPVATLTNDILRLGSSIPQEEWTNISNLGEITDYGVMIYKTDSEDNINSETPVEDAYRAGVVQPAIARTGHGNAPTAVDGNCVFTARVRVSNNDTIFYAASFMVVGGHYYFFNEQHIAAGQLA